MVGKVSATSNSKHTTIIINEPDFEEFVVWANRYEPALTKIGQRSDLGPLMPAIPSSTVTMTA